MIRGSKLYVGCAVVSIKEMILTIEKYHSRQISAKYAGTYLQYLYVEPFSGYPPAVHHAVTYENSY